MPIRFGAFIITFNRPAGVRRMLERLLAQTRPPDLILVVDNGQPEPTNAVIEDFSGQPIVHQPMGDNLGPAGAAAFGFKWLVDKSFDWLYWGDDDNPPHFDDDFERVLRVGLEVVATNVRPVGAVGAVGALFDWRRGESVRLADEELRGIVRVDTIGGNSQIVVRREAVQQVGVPNPDLFFGYYEPEYCLRMGQAGYRLFVDGDRMWQYRELHNRLNFKRQRAIVSALPYQLIWRRYYRTRNYIAMMRTTFRRPDLARREALKACGRAGGSWARGAKYGAAFTRLQLQGIVDGYRGRLGRTVLPKPKYG
jgi:GT2 family glycosyltransferase